MKKILSLILVVAIVLSFGTLTAVAATPDGSEANPYLVSSKAEISAAVSKITAGSSNNHIKLISNITLTGYSYIGNMNKEIVFDMNSYTITTDSVIDFYAGTIKNGIITSSDYPALRLCGNNANSTVYVENVEIISTNALTNAYALRIIEANAVLNNCNIKGSGGTGIDFWASSTDSLSPNPPAVEYTATLTNVDITATTYACEVRNQMEDVTESLEPGDPTFYYPHAYYTAKINGITVSDVNSEEYVRKQGNIAGGYDDSWKQERGNLSITYTIAEPTYTVTIPATVTLGNTAEVKIEDAVCPTGYEVKVALTGTSGESNAFTLKNAADDTLTYTVTKDSANVAVGDVVVNTDSGDKTTVLSFNEPASTPNPGEYTGTVTFTVSWGLE